MVYCAVTTVRPLDAQLNGSVGAGVGTVRYAGGSTSSAALLSSDLQIIGSIFSTTAAGSIAALPNAAWYASGRAGVWAVSSPLGDHFRLGTGVDWTGTTRTNDGRTAALDGLVEGIWSWGTAGTAVGLGPSWGWVSGAGAVTAAHLRVRAWWNPAPIRLTMTVEPTKFPGGWFTDVTTQVRYARGALSTALSISGRLSAPFGSKGAASLQAAIRLAPSLSVEAAGGSYLPDPYQGFPRAAFFDAGIRISLGPPAPAWRSDLTRLRDNDTTALRFTVSADSEVAIAGDWNGWRPDPLRRIDAHHWELRIALPRGTYYFNLLVDGVTWVVPDQVAKVADDFGRTVGVLVVN